MLYVVHIFLWSLDLGYIVQGSDSIYAANWVCFLLQKTLAHSYDGGEKFSPNHTRQVLGVCLIYIKYTFCKQIGQNRPNLSTAESETIYRGLYRVATAN